MTPLARQLMKRFTLPIRKRESVYDPDNMLSLLDDFHCFETTAIVPMARELMNKINETDPRSLDQLIFLPAPRTWIERVGERPGRKWRGATFFVTEKGGKYISEFAVQYEPEDLSRTWTLFRCGRLNVETKRLYWWDHDASDGSEPYSEAAFDLVELAIINSPRIIGRRQHMPHRGVERDLRRSLGVGKFPLHAWTEIILDVSKPVEIDDGEPHEAHLTGRRALHFCRKHIRIRLGKLEYVSAHWRGDPAIGIKRSRYVVTA